MKIGRNDPCPCGSGKKYTNCCLNVRENPELLWKKNFSNLCDIEVNKDKIADIFYMTYKLVEETNWLGACHIISAIQYILLNELGIEAKLCIGVLEGRGMKFDHSWLELKNKIYDVTLVNSLEGKLSNCIVAGYDIFTLEKIDFTYGINERLDSPAKEIKEVSIRDYLDEFSKHINYSTPKLLRAGLWNLILNLSKELDMNLSIEELRNKYADTKRTSVK